MSFISTNMLHIKTNIDTITLNVSDPHHKFSFYFSKLMLEECNSMGFGLGMRFFIWETIF